MKMSGYTLLEFLIVIAICLLIALIVVGHVVGKIATPERSHALEQYLEGEAVLPEDAWWIEFDESNGLQYVNPDHLLPYVAVLERYFDGATEEEIAEKAARELTPVLIQRKIPSNAEAQ